ncbi:MAG: alpha/beta hydrolase [Candidatus Nanopelagicales bacterium]|nr:alpha/beta hydrolase [Candidatus Nanopelagicales bacterium]
MASKFGRGAGLAALVAAGVAIGLGVEEAVVGRRFRPDPVSREPFGLLRGEQVDVLADDGVIIHVEVDEPPAPAPADLTILFVHGYGLNQDCWHYQRRDLYSLGRLAFMDQRAHGLSFRGHPDRTTIAQLGSDLRAVIDAISPTGPVVLVGHSMGGMTVLSLAAREPEFFTRHVAGVALLATTSGGLSEAPLGLPEPIGMALHRVIPSALEVATGNQALVEAGRRRAGDLTYLLTKRYSFGSQASPALTQFVADMVSSTPVDVIAEFFEAVEGFEEPGAARQLAGIETLVMVGDVDRITTPDHSHEIVRHAPHAELVLLPDTGHMLMLERWPEVNAHLIGLVERVRARGWENGFDGKNT